MKLYAPKYYANFKCIADKCEHNCCTGWEIDIDKVTLEKYKRLKGGYSDTIKESISFEDEPHFRLGEDERCPHLDEHGLCKIICCVGEDYLSDICREHPRFYNYTNVAEVGIGMSCPEAARVILCSPDYASFEEIGETEKESVAPIFDGVGERNRIFEILGDSRCDYQERLRKIYRDYSIDARNDAYWLKLLDSLEYLDDGHKRLFMNYSARARSDGNEEYLERFLAYLFYRHVTEAVDKEDFSARLGFCLFLERLFDSLISYEKAKSLNEIAYLASVISEEIEYSEDNTFILTY